MSNSTIPGLQRELFIGGRFTAAQDGRTFQTHAPGTGAVIGEVAEAAEADVDLAVRAARAALDGEWGALDLGTRAALLRRVADLIEERSAELAELESLDGGKPIRDARPQVGVAAAWFGFFADIAQRARTSVIPGLPGHFNYTLRKPLGVVGLIVPWNFPLALYGIKMPAALAMGNAVILKPAEQTPLTALALADICREAGLPDGAVNVLPGFGETAGRALVEHPGVDAISFTGSTDVGRDIAARAGQRLKKVTLELGGKSPNIVFADADLDAAADTSLFTFATHQGQLCSAGSRLLVEDAVHDEFLARLVERAQRLRVGLPSDPESQLGAVITPEQLERIERYVDIGAKDGATKVLGEGRPTIANGENGTYYSPTIFAGVRSGHRIAQEEIFGPVLSVIPFRDEAEAVTLANDVLYGLAAGVWTSRLDRAHRMADAVEAGLVYVNTMNVLSPGSPYSGWKASGLGVEGGIEQAESFTKLKSVWVRTEGANPVL